jgi:hypothetical protein
MASDFECSIMVVDELLAQNTNNGANGEGLFIY